MAEVKVKPEVPDPMDIESRCCGRPRAAEEAAGLGVGVWRPRRTRFGAGGSRRGGAVLFRAWGGWFGTRVLIGKWVLEERVVGGTESFVLGGA